MRRRGGDVLIAAADHALHADHDRQSDRNAFETSAMQCMHC